MPVPALQRFEKFFQATSDCQFYVKRDVDGQFRYVHVNPAALRVTGGRTEHDIVGLTPMEALGEDYGSTVEENIKAAFETRQAHHFRGSLGSDTHGPIYDAFYFPLLDDAGDIAGVLGSARDISEISSLNERRLNGEKLEALGRISGSVVHDFNNILAAFEALLIMLNRKNIDDARRELILQEGRRTLETGKALTERLTMFARQEKIRAVPHDIKKLLKICQPVLQRVLGRATKLSIECEADLWKACCDRSEFEIALVNLATNARDALGDNGEVVISARNCFREPHDPSDIPAAFVEVRFADNGCGMDQETASQAIDPFFTTKPEGKGTGLGLSSIAKFVSEVGGAIQVESELGIGTTISLLLPEQKAEH